MDEWGFKSASLSLMVAVLSLCSHFIPFLCSHSRLQPAAQDPELRGGSRSGPHQREDAPPSRQQSVRGCPLPQQPAGQHWTFRQERHQRTGLNSPPLLPISPLLLTLFCLSFPPSFLLSYFHPSCFLLFPSSLF